MNWLMWMGRIVSMKEGNNSSVCSMNVWKEEDITSNYKLFKEKEYYKGYWT